jgi:cytidylate kinase
VVLIGGRAGSGKSTVAAEMHLQLSARGVHHGWIEGDNLDMAHPIPWRQGHHLAEDNLAAMWANYRALGHSRLIYNNTASVLPGVIASLAAAMGDDPVVHAILLTAGDAAAEARLGRREIGSGLAGHTERGRVAARELEAACGPEVHRVPTDERNPTEIAAEIIAITCWDAG